MIKDITIGQYFPGNSFVHRLDPRVKILATILYITSIFFVKHFVMYLPLVAVLVLTAWVSKLPPKMITRGLKPLYFIIGLTMVLNFFMTPGERIWSWGILELTKEGIHQGVFMALRLVFLMVGTSLLTLTTSPMRLTDGMEAGMKPLSRLGFPGHELAMMMTIALRFIPTLFEEADKIMKAQMARGADFESGNVFRRAKNMIPLLVPLFLNSLKRAEDLATAMEARCYRGGDDRTRLNPLEYRTSDYVTYVGMILFFGFIVAVRYLW